jgi:putative tricarboxylic transport membrane protein
LSEPERSAWRPQREIEIVAGTPPGGGLDRAARALLKAIESTRLLDVPARVNNVPGDGARKCWAYLDQRQGDPHVVAISSANLTTDHLLGTTAFDHEAAFTPLAILYTEYIAFLARGESPLKSGADLLKRLGTNAGAVTVALSTSLGNPNHIALAKVVRHAGGDVKAPKVRVFDSALDAVADVLAGNADVCAVTAASAVKELGAGSMRALAVSAPRRLNGLYAKTPTWVEHSVDCVIGAWRGVTGASGITPAQIAFWESTLAAAVKTGAWSEELARLYWTPAYLDGAELREQLQRERTEMNAVLQDLGLLK